jgi:hypothetical protein
MAGVQGMGSPNQVKDKPALPPQAPEMPAVDTQTANPAVDADLEAAFNAAQSSEIDSMEADFQAAGGEASLGSTFAERAVNQLKDVGNKALGFVGDVGEAIMSPVTGAAAEVASTVEKTPLSVFNPQEIVSQAVKGAAKGVVSPLSQPSVTQSVSKAFPELGKGVKISIPQSSVSTGTNDIFFPNEFADRAVEGQKPFETEVSPAQAIDLAANLLAPDAVIVGISKAPAIAKLAGKGLGSVLNSVKSFKPAGKLEAAVAPVEALSKEMQIIKQAADEVSAIGEKIPLTVNMADPTNPVAQSAAKEISNSKVYQDLQSEIGDRMVRNISEHIPKAFANLADDASTTDDIFATVQKARAGTGSKMGELKKQAAKELGNGRLPAPEFQKEVDNILERLTTPDEANKLYISDPKKYDELVNYVQKISDDVFNAEGRLTFGEWEKIYKGLTSKAQSSYQAGAETSHIWGKLRSSLSRAEDGMMAQGLEFVNPEAAAKFIKAKGDYGSIMGAYDELGSMLDKNEIVADSLIKKLFDSEATSPEKASAVLKVLGIENPKMVQDLRGRAYKYLLNENKTPYSPKNPFGIDFDGFAKKIRDMQGSSPESRNMLDIMTGSKESSKAMLNLAEAAQAFSRGYTGKSEVINEALLGRVAYYASQMKSNSPRTWIAPILDVKNRNDKFAIALKNVDIDELTKAWPPNKRKEAKLFLQKAFK